MKTQNESRRNGCHAADVLQIQAQHVTDGKGGGIIDQCRQNGVCEIPVFLQKGNGNEGMIFSPFENDKRIAGNDTDAEPDQRMPRTNPRREVSKADAINAGADAMIIALPNP